MSILKPSGYRTGFLSGSFGFTGFKRLSTAASASSAAPAWTPLSLSGLELWVHSHATNHLWVDAGNVQALTRSVADNDPVGWVDSPVLGHVLGSSAASTRPALHSGSGSNSALLFDRATSDRLVVDNSTNGAFNFIHETGIGTIMMHVGMRSGSAVYDIIDNRNNTTVNAGFDVSRTTTNKIRFAVAKKVSGQFVYDYTTVATLQPASGVVPMIIIFSGTGGTIQLGDNAVEGFARSTALPVTGVNPAGDLTIGGLTGGGSQFADMVLQDLVIMSTTASASDVTNFKAWNPARTATSLLQATSNAAGYYNFLARWYDFTAKDTLWQDITRTTPVAVHADPVAVASNRLEMSSSLGIHLNRSASLEGTGSTVPFFQSGSYGAAWDGVDDNLNMKVWSKNGAFTIFMVMANDDNLSGSHLLTNPSARIGCSGPAYVSNPLPGRPYWTLHPSTGNTSGSFLVRSGTHNNGWNVVEARRDGDAFTQRSTKQYKVTSTNNNDYTPTDIGDFSAGLSDYQLYGRVRCLMKFNVCLTDAQADSVVDHLMSVFTDL